MPYLILWITWWEDLSQNLWIKSDYSWRFERLNQVIWQQFMHSLLADALPVQEAYSPSWRSRNMTVDLAVVTVIAIAFSQPSDFITNFLNSSYRWGSKGLHPRWRTEPPHAPFRYICSWILENWYQILTRPKSAIGLQQKSLSTERLIPTLVFKRAC